MNSLSKSSYQLSDSTLLELFQNERDNNERKYLFEVLYNRYAKQTIQDIKRRTDNLDDQEDLHAEVWWAVLEKIETLQIDTSFKAWLFGIIRNKAYELYRKNDKKHQCEIEIDEASNKIKVERAFTASYDVLLEDIINSDNKKKAKEIIPHALLILGAKNPEYQDILVYYYLEGLNNKEIAEILGKRPNTIRVAKFRAKEMLAKIITELLKNGHY